MTRHTGEWRQAQGSDPRLGAGLPSWGRLAHSSAARSRLAPGTSCSAASPPQAPPWGPVSWPSHCCHQSLHVVTTAAAAPSRHHRSTRIHAGPSPGAWHWGGHRSAAGGLSLTLVSTNLRVNRARPVSRAHQGHQAPPDRVDLWGIQDCQGLWGHL